MKHPRENLSDDFESDPLWDLLGKADQPHPAQVSPYFARNVVREIRLSTEKSRQKPQLAQLAQPDRFFATFSTLLGRWRALASSVAAAGIIALLYSSVTLNGPEADSLTASAGLAQSPYAGDLEVIKNLDELLDIDTVWLDSTVSVH